ARAEDLPPRSEVLGDAERVASTLLVETQKACRNRRAAQGIPRTGAVIVACRRMERDARARRDFVTQREADDELAAVYAGCSACSRALDQCEQCRQERGARVPRGPHMAVVSD